jgi:CelD/BcsL family acetyltransferase involved in cellulose biosynthesis
MSAVLAIASEDARRADASRALSCDTIRDASAFAALAGSWDGLVRATPRASPFMLHSWLLEWWRHFGSGRELAVHVARRDGALVAALPLFVRSQFGFRVASFLGNGESALADVLLAAGAPATAASALIDHVEASGIDAVDVFGLSRESRLAAVGPSRIQLIQRVESPVIDVGHDWKGFYETKLHSSRRRTIRKRARGLEAEGKVAVEHAKTPEAVGATIDDLFRLHQLRWGSRPDHSTLGTPVGQRFHRAALVALAHDGVVRVTTVRVDGRSIAFQCWFALGSSAYLYRQSYDPAFARFGLGFRITLDAIEAAVAEGISRIELLGGAEPVKLELADRMDPMHQGVGLARGVRGRAFVAARVAALRAYQRLRGSEQLRRLYYHEGLASARRAVASLRG